MCRKIDRPLFATDIPEILLNHVITYCANKHFTKTTNGLQFPLKSNALKDNHYIQDSDIQQFGPLLDDFQALKDLMRAAKIMGCEALYQLMAAALASWFRRRTIRDVSNDLRLEYKNPYETTQLTARDLEKAQRKFSHFLEKIDYPQITLARL
jgi:hypothetical protein